MPMPIQSSSVTAEMLENAMMATLSSAAAAGADCAARTGPGAGRRNSVPRSAAAAVATENSTIVSAMIMGTRRSILQRYLVSG